MNKHASSPRPDVGPDALARHRPVWWPSPALSSWLLLAIVLAGVLFRFAFLGDIRHGYDEGYPAYDALRMLDGGQLLLLGQPSSVFLDNPPLMAYLQTIPLLFERSLWSVYLFIAALNSIAVWFVYQATRRLLGVPAALIAAALFAINPWVVHFSRVPWVQGLLPLFTAIFAWGVWPALVQGRSRERNVFVGMLALTAIVQSYILGFALLAPVALLALLFWRRLPKRPFLAGVLVLLATVALFGLGLSLEGARNAEKFESFASENELQVNGQALEHAVRLVSGLDYAGQAPEVDGGFPRRDVSRAVHWLLAVALLCGGVRALLALRQEGRERRLAAVLLVWFLAPVVGLMFLPYLVHPHYLLLSLPAGHLLAAWGMVPLARFRWGRLTVALFLIAVAALFWRNLDRAGQAVADAPVGRELNGWRVADAAALGSAINDLVPGDNPPERVVAAANSPLLSSISGRLVESVSDLAFPDFVLLPGDDPLLYVVVGGEPRSPLLGGRQEAVPEYALTVGGNTQVSFVRVMPYDRAEALALPDTTVEWTSSAGLSLLGYTLESPRPVRAGDSLVVTSYWRVEDLHPDREEWLVSPYFQILNEEWQLLVNMSVDGRWGDSWRLGDVYVYRTTIPLGEGLEPGAYRLGIGLADNLHGTAFSLNAPEGPASLHLVPLSVEP